MATDKRSGVNVSDCAVSEVGGEQIVRGVIDVDSLDKLLVAPYQREALPVMSADEWGKVFARGHVPDIDLGMRGARFDLLGNGAVCLLDPVYIVDGLQRVTAARAAVAKGHRPYLGATIHFNTTEESERDRFQQLNTKRVKLNANVVLANLRYDSSVVQALYDLTTSGAGFVLSDRVSWRQRTQQTDLMNASTLLKVVGELHSHLGATRYRDAGRLVRGLQAVVDEIGPERFVANVTYFFDLVNELWGLGDIHYRGRSVPNQYAFLGALARLFSDHVDFWQGRNTLFVRQPERTKLGKYPISDPSVQAVVASGRDSVYRDLLNHINSGRRHGHLRMRRALV